MLKALVKMSTGILQGIVGPPITYRAVPGHWHFRRTLNQTPPAEKEDITES